MAGSDVTFANCWVQLGLAAKIFNWLDLEANASTPNYEAMEDALTTALDGLFTPGILGVVRSRVRASLQQALAVETLREAFQPAFLDMLRAIGSTELGDGGAIDLGRALGAIRQYMVTNAQTINSRGMTLDVAGATTATGTGAVYRCIVDQDGKTLECTGAEDKTFYCTKDQNTRGGTKHAETFEFRTEDAAVDRLQWVGSGRVTEIKSLNAKSGGLVVNPSFESGAVADDTALTTNGQINGWDVTTAARWKTRSAAGYTYRGYQNDQGVTHYGLECIVSDQIVQVLKAENQGATFREGVPYRCQIAWMRKASSTGTLTLHLGAVSKAVDISTGVNDAWNILAIDLDEDAYLKAFNQDALSVKAVVSTLATGTVVIDDFVLDEMENLDGTWWCVVGGATPWKRRDTILFDADADGTRAILSYWLWRAYGDDLALLVAMGGWFPTLNDGNETITDPA